MPHGTIDHSKEIFPGLSVLSFVRRLKEEHAFLVLESINDEGQRINLQIHLLIRPNTKHTKAMVVIEEISLEELAKLSKGCVAQSWQMDAHRVNALLFLAEAEKSRDINYVMFGKSSLNGLFARSYGSDERPVSVNDSMQTKSIALAYSGHSVDMLLRSGHNCVSWAAAMVTAMQLEYTRPWKEFFVVTGSAALPSSSCLMM